MSTISTAAELTRGDALLIVDPQNDFCPGGALGVASGDRIMSVLNAWAAAADAAQAPIFVSRDWHPARTTHFKEFGGVWPPHCVMGTHGAEFHPDLHLPADACVVSKGMGEAEDAYSAFQARDESGTLLGALLQHAGIHRLYIGGLATDYCVQSSALDAVKAGYQVTVIADAIAAVNLQPDDGAHAVEAMRAAGVSLYGQT